MSDKGLNSRYSHHLDARARAHAHTRTIWFCRASVSHVVRNCTIIYSPKSGGNRARRGSKREDNGRTVPHRGPGRDRKPQTAADWVRSLAVCRFPPPLPRQNNRRRENARVKTSAQCGLFTCSPMNQPGQACTFESVLPLSLC